MLTSLLDEVRCYAYFRALRWPQGVCCPYCHLQDVRREHQKKLPAKYHCGRCGKHFNDLTGTVIANSKLSLGTWFMIIYMLYLGLSHLRISRELGLTETSVLRVGEIFRQQVEAYRTQEPLTGWMEIDECYHNAGYKGQPLDQVEELDRDARRRGNSKRGRGTYDTDRLPIVGFVQRGGKVILEVMQHLRKDLLRPVIASYLALKTEVVVLTDEFAIYGYLSQEGYTHHTVNHSKGEYAKDLDGDGHCEIHVNTAEGIWSLLRPYLRAYRGIHKDHLPRYVASFELFINLQRTSQPPLEALVAYLIKPPLIEDMSIPSQHHQLPLAA